MVLRTRIVLAGISHALALIVLAAACLAVHLAAKPFQRVFFCNDESIAYPLHKGTVPFGVCIGVGVVLGIVIVVAVESLRHCYAPVRVKAGRPRQPTLLAAVGYLVPEKFSPLVAGIVAGLYYLAFACLTNEIFTVVGKMGFGRLRPHFLEACQLNSTCQPGRRYTPDFCLKPNPSEFDNAQKSFPSGHSSFSMAVCVYLALYLQFRLSFRHPLHSLLNLIQLALILMGASVAMSRVSDYKHHWSDILAGGLLGSLCGALLAVKFWVPPVSMSQGLAASVSTAASPLRPTDNGGAGGGGGGAKGTDYVI